MHYSKIWPPMSAVGHERPNYGVRAMSASLPTATKSLHCDTNGTRNQPGSPALRKPSLNLSVDAIFDDA